MENKKRNILKEVLKKTSLLAVPGPIGYSLLGFVQDRIAQKKSEKGLSDIQARAAEALRKSNRERMLRNKAEQEDLLNNQQIESLKTSNMDDASRNALFEQDMRRRQRLNLPR
jgi:hypothetical protein